MTCDLCKFEFFFNSCRDYRENLQEKILFFCCVHIYLCTDECLKLDEASIAILVLALSNRFSPNRFNQHGG